eukprot:gene5360-13951_t
MGESASGGDACHICVVSGHVAECHTSPTLPVGGGACWVCLDGANAGALFRPCLCTDPDQQLAPCWCATVAPQLAPCWCATVAPQWRFAGVDPANALRCRQCRAPFRFAAVAGAVPRGAGPSLCGGPYAPALRRWAALIGLLTAAF